MSRYLHSLLYNWVTLFFCAMSCFVGTSVVAQMVKNLPAMQETHVQSLGWEDPLEKGMTPHSGTLAWRIPRTEEPGGLQSMGSQRVRHDWVTKHCTCFLVFTVSFLLPKTNKQTNKRFSFTVWSYRKGSMEEVQKNWPNKAPSFWKVQSLLSGKSQEYNSSSDIEKVRIEGDRVFRKNW